MDDGEGFWKALLGIVLIAGLFFLWGYVIGPAINGPLPEPGPPTGNPALELPAHGP